MLRKDSKKKGFDEARNLISVESIGEVKKFRMARSILGRPVYYTAAYWLDDLLIDTGCSHTTQELLSAVKGLDLYLVVNTHSHEDHIVANSALSEG